MTFRCPLGPWLFVVPIEELPNLVRELEAERGGFPPSSSSVPAGQQYCCFLRRWPGIGDWVPSLIGEWRVARLNGYIEAEVARFGRTPLEFSKYIRYFGIVVSETLKDQKASSSSFSVSSVYQH